MQVTITGRNIEVTETLRSYTREKIAKIEKYIHNIVAAHVILVVEKYRHIAEITIQTHGAVLKGSEETGDMYSSIDMVMDKIEIQAKKLKDRITEKSHGPADEADAEAEAAPAREQEVGGTQMPRVIRTDAFAAKPMTAEEAAMQMHLGKELFVVYYNAKNGKVNVLYRRSDGNFGLIEPL